MNAIRVFVFCAWNKRALKRRAIGPFTVPVIVAV